MPRAEKVIASWDMDGVVGHGWGSWDMGGGRGTWPGHGKSGWGWWEMDGSRGTLLGLVRHGWGRGAWMGLWGKDGVLGHASRPVVRQGTEGGEKLLGGDMSFRAQ